MKKIPELFDQWNEQKKRIEFETKNTIDARVGEFWRYWEGINVGNEISKDGFFKRVCLILENDMGNWLYLIAPLTTKYNYQMKDWYVPVHKRRKYSLKQSSIVMNQIKLIDAKRISHITWSYAPNISLRNLILNMYIALLQKRLHA